MDIEEIKGIIEAQRAFFKTGATLNVKARRARLVKLRESIRRHEADIADALHADLGKGADESYMCETGLVLSEISYLIKHVKKLSKPRRCKTPLAQYVSKSYELPSPYGNVLVMSPWNYPFLLSVDRKSVV